MSPWVCPHCGFVPPHLVSYAGGRAQCLGAPEARSPPGAPGMGQDRAVPLGWGCPTSAHGRRGGRGTPAPLPNRGHHPIGHISPHCGGRGQQGEGLRGLRHHGGRTMLWRDGDPGWGNPAMPTALPMDPDMSPLPRIRPSAQGRLGTARWGKAHQDIERLLAFLSLTPSARYPTLGSPRGYLTPSLGTAASSGLGEGPQHPTFPRRPWEALKKLAWLWAAYL